MKLIQTLIVHRLSISFLMLLILIVSCAPLVYYEEIVWAIIPISICILLITWLGYSSGAKEKLKIHNVIKPGQTDIVEEIEKACIPSNNLKKLLAAYGLSIGIMLLLLTATVVISVDILTDYATPLSLLIVFVLVYGLSYLIIKNKIK